MEDAEVLPAHSYNLSVLDGGINIDKDYEQFAKSNEPFAKL